MKVIFEKKGAIAYVTINRPERLMLVTSRAYGRLAEIWREFRDDPALRVAILTGTRRTRLLRGQRRQVQLRRRARARNRPIRLSR